MDPGRARAPVGESESLVNWANGARAEEHDVEGVTQATSGECRYLSDDRRPPPASTKGPPRHEPQLAPIRLPARHRRGHHVGAGGPAPGNGRGPRPK
jgi:hypothetical protein